MLRLTQVLLLSKQNQGLREGIDAVEKEMASLHDMIEARDDAAQKLKREGDRLRREIKRLRVRLGQNRCSTLVRAEFKAVNMLLWCLM